MEETEESRKSDDEILAIIRRDRSTSYEIIPPHMMRTLEPMLIQNWRLSKMKVISGDAIYVEQPDGRGYVRQAVTSIDFDLEMLNAFIDAFLIACFGRFPGP